MGKSIKEFTVAPDETLLKSILPEVNCISQALLNQWILSGRCKTLHTAEIVLPTGIKYFKVWAEVEETDDLAG
jgi:hypothetical protein